ncbi:CBS domain-containing protein [Sphingopyxis chilensis]
MKISERMTPNPQTVAPDDSVRRAAELMDQFNVGALPVCDDGRLVGIVTDRDITVRATALGSPPDSTNVSEVMTEPACSISPDSVVADAEQMMGAAQIRRVPVVDDAKHVVGMLSLGDLAVAREQGVAATLEAVSQPSSMD